MDWLDLLTVQGTLKSLLQHHSSKASILRHSAFFTVQPSHPYMTTGKTIALTRWTLVGKVMSLLLNMLSRLVITFLPRSKHLLTHWKRLWCWEGLGGGGEGDDRGWDGWMASPTRWTWIWVNSRSWWWTGRPGMLWFMGSQRVGHDWMTELNWTEHLLRWSENLLRIKPLGWESQWGVLRTPKAGRDKRTYLAKLAFPLGHFNNLQSFNLPNRSLQFPRQGVYSS